MGTRGRKPKPTAVKLFEGNPGRRPLNKDEPKPRSGRPTCPATIKEDDVARKKWNELCRELDAMGVLSKADGGILELIAITYSDLVKARDRVVEDGMLATTSNGNQIQSPHLSIVNQCKKLLASLYPEVGLTPSGRTRLKVGGQGKQSRLSKYLEGRPA